MNTEAWLVSAGRVLASAHIAATRAERRRGLLGRSTFDGAFVLPRCRSVHTFGMQFPIDVAFLDRDRQVIRIMTKKPNRLCIHIRKTDIVIEARHGAFERWGLRVGDVVEIRPSQSGGTSTERSR